MHIRQQIRKRRMISGDAFIERLSMSVAIVVGAGEEEAARTNEDAELQK